MGGGGAVVTALDHEVAQVEENPDRDHAGHLRQGRMHRRGIGDAVLEAAIEDVEGKYREMDRQRLEKQLEEGDMHAGMDIGFNIDKELLSQRKARQGD